ncbi:ABC transporter substrate-binding protein [Jatrophihabitans sp. YIM 134969]
MPGIASLLPSATEIVLALGLGDRLVGVTDECVAPADVPVVVRARQPADLTPGEVDAWVREHAAEGLYDVDDDLLGRLTPDVVLTQDLCHVCALPADDVDRALEKVGCPSAVVTLRPSTLAEVLASVAEVATAAGEPEVGVAAVGALQARLDAVAVRLRGHRRVPTLVLEWLDPPFTGGHWVPDVVAAAGGEPLLGVSGRPSGPTTWDVCVASEPEVVVLSPCGTPADEAAAQVALLPGPLAARRPVVLDLAQPGPGLVAAVESLAARLHPSANADRCCQRVGADSTA